MRAITLLTIVAAGACSAPAYSLRVPVHEASYGALVSAAADAMNQSAGGLDRIDEPSGIVRLLGSKGVEEVEVTVERGRAETTLEVFISRPEFYPPGVGEAFWERFRRRFDTSRKNWRAVESGERSAGL